MLWTRFFKCGDGNHSWIWGSRYFIKKDLKFVCACLFLTAELGQTMAYGRVRLFLLALLLRGLQQTVLHPRRIRMRVWIRFWMEWTKRLYRTVQSVKKRIHLHPPVLLTRYLTLAELLLHKFKSHTTIHIKISYNIQQSFTTSASQTLRLNRQMSMFWSRGVQIPGARSPWQINFVLQLLVY